MSLKNQLLLTITCLAIVVFGLQPVYSSEDPEVENLLVLVAGASGRTGQQVISQLAEQNIPVRAMTRNVQRAKERVGNNFNWVKADASDPDSLKAVMQGVTHVISAMGSSSKDPTNTPRSVDYQGTINLVDAAKENSVKHFVLISAMGVTRSKEIDSEHMQKLLNYKLDSEDYLRASGLNYTVIRPGGLRNWEAGKRKLELTQGDKKPFADISRADLARVSVESMTNVNANKKTFELTGEKEGDGNSWIKRLSELRQDQDMQ